jgi:flagellar protein FliO/FliZ
MNTVNPAATTSLIWFVVIICLIPLALWLLKRTPMGGSASGGMMRTIAALPISANQRIVTVEVGQGEHRRWLVLGVTAQTITTLHTMEPQGDGATVGVVGGSSMPQTPFAQMLSRLRNDRKDPGAS